MLLAIVRLLSLLVKLLGARLDADRLPDGAAKRGVLDAISRATKSIPLAVALRVMGLTASRYHAWRQLSQECRLEDRTSCPKTMPTQLTADELKTMRDMATDEGLRHMPLRGLALHAQRVKKVFAAPATWARLIRERGWLRPRRRVHPARPHEGLRATKPNEYWHLDVTIIKLLDGTRVYLHAVIDNYSRRILAWKPALRLEPHGTCAILADAATNLPAEAKPTLVADSGVENVNSEVDKVLGLGQLRRVLAQVEISFSNSMIEAWWRSLKHNWLFLNQLDSLAAVERLVGFYVDQHNSVIPHSAFRGQTPGEMYFATGTNVPNELAAAAHAARQARIAANRALKCEDCHGPPPPPAAASGVQETSGDPSVLHLRQNNSGMS
ncbi:MAG: transposase [Myxococcaceae bacterium]